MKKVILVTLMLFFLNQKVNANQQMEYRCLVDYTQLVMNAQAYYIQNKSYKTAFDFNELGIRISSDNDPYYPERFFHLDESLVRDYKITINGTLLTLKSNDKTLISADLNNLGENIKISAQIQSYTPSDLFVDFYFYNPETMKNEINLQINFGDQKIVNEFVSRSWGFKGTYDYYLDCQDEIEKTTFKEYQQHWISLYEAISKKKAEYTN
ncbi:hypothetical protein ACTFQF_05160 [Aliivibrio fischeri]|uniref:hypothetical protein n=1 Tax=Aliivibrio fischeri TaxID=668 RepID=UPI0007C4A6EF|nr:hypothetical protein [Aliivibrio fischeri]MBP3140620.1 hypothetical protein [Aliivibrio fischeri]MBP3156074.1 hypothetical protein [Aliivibrio fischeri]MCE7574396.1 hypothetical protein [Aliivibrio fischeri]